MYGQSYPADMSRFSRFFEKRRKTKIVFIFILILLIVGSQLAKRSMNALENFGPKEMAQVPLITHLPWDAERIYALTPYRANAGHDFTYRAWDGETCRTLKHYINYPAFGKDPNVRSIPESGETNINLYAPFDGVFSIDVPGVNQINPARKSLGVGLVVTSKENSHWKVNIGHSDALAGLKPGTDVKAGQLIGTIGPKDGSEVSYEANLSGGKVVYQSIFEHITKEAFAPFAKLGFTTSDFIISRAEADAKHYRCVGSGGWQPYVASPQVACGTPCVPPNFIFIRTNPYPSQESQGQAGNTP